MASNFERQSDFSLDLGSTVPSKLASKARWLYVILGLVLLVLVINFLRSVYTDYLWYDQLGFASVMIKVIMTRVVLFVIGGLVLGTALGISLFFANRISQGPEEIALPKATRDVLRKLIRWGSVAVVVVLSVVFGSIAAGQWEIFLRFGSSVPFGVVDPVYGRDISFYVFSLPVYEFIQGWLLGACVVVLLATLVLYFANYNFRGAGFLITSGVKAQVSIIVGLFFLTLAFGHWLDRWALVLSDHGAVFGAAYADLHARQPALLILTIIAFASSVLILINAYMQGIRLLVGGVALWIVTLLLFGSGWPNAVQRITVSPNEFVRESQYIERNIELTRSGFGLTDKDLTVAQYPVEPSVTADLINANIQTVDNIRLWDTGPLSSVYRQIQLIRPYYDFNDADVDRYMVDGQYRQVMLAAREVSTAKLASESQTWVNEKLRYTHGFGVAMSPVTEFTQEGRPEFFAKDIPFDGVITVQAEGSTSEPETVITNPRIYFGESTDNYVIVNSNTDELDYQAEGGQIKSVNYGGKGGVAIGSLINRMAYAWEFGDLNVLITREINTNSRIQYRRSIQERISTIAPFLRLDDDPYIVAADGGLFWVQDAYTVSDKYPYSDPHPEGFNYIRNSVKVTVDAYHGTVRFYIWDLDDPLVATYKNIFPSLFISKEEMSDSLRSHTRYPRDMFRFQAEKYLKYHMSDPQDFYNLEDIWSIPSEKFGQGGDLQRVEPYYVITKIPGESTEEFVLLLPYTRNDPPIMAGWLAARNDGEVYGDLVAFMFPKERQVDSPEQIEAKIDNDPDISEWFTLRCQEGSFCIRGNLLVIPVVDGDTFGLLYAEPVYLQAEGVEFPELKQVILATGDKVVMSDSISDAVKDLTGFEKPSVRVDQDGIQTSTGSDTELDRVRAIINGLTESLQDLRDTLQGFEDALQSLTQLTEGE